MSFSALIGMFTFVTPALIHWFTRKYVFKLQYDPKTETYAATTLTFFLREKTVSPLIELSLYASVIFVLVIPGKNMQVKPISVAYLTKS